MVVAINRLRVPDEYASRLEQAFGHSGSMQGVPGFLRFELLKRSEGGEYLVVTHWESQEAFTAWRQSDASQRAHSGSNPHSPVTSQLETYEVVLAQP
jgi:heme oxygenase (staphylobilin-producing)